MAASYLVPLITAVRSAVGTAWPECKANGIYHSVELARIPFEQKATGSLLPVAVMDFDLREGEWAADSATEEGPVTIYRVVQDSESLEALIGKLETLRNQLYDNALTAGQVIGWPRISWSMDLLVNRYFLNTQKPFIAGAVIAVVTVDDL